MTKENYTHLVLVVDRSGSMSLLAKEVSGSINQLFIEQREIPGDLTVSLYQFDDEYEKVFGPTAIKDVPEYTLKSRGMTALNDAVGRAINETGAFLEALPEALRPSKVVFNIVTDGEENASKEFNLNKVQEMIKHQTEKYNWEFIFMASNIDAQTAAQTYGAKSFVQSDHSAAGYARSYTVASTALGTYRMNEGVSMNQAIADADATVVPVDTTTSNVAQKEAL